MARRMIDSSREEIINKLRVRLSQQGGGTADAAVRRKRARVKSIDDDEIVSLLTQLGDEIQSVSGNYHTANDEEGIVKHILKLARNKSAENFSMWETDYLRQLGVKKALRESGLKLITAKNKNRLANANIGITEVDYAIADTGTLVLLTEKQQPRSISLLPPIHVAVVRADNIVRNINELFAILSDSIKDTGSVASCMTFITGPSRTADIELNLTLGVHGPKELYVVALS